MPSLKINSQIATESYSELRSSEHQHETNDCSVIALTKACGVDYAAAHRACSLYGRKERRGLNLAGIERAAQTLGFKLTTVSAQSFISRYPKGHQILRSVTTHHPHRFNKVWADGKNYLIWTRGHIAAVINGVNTDWVRKHSKRVLGIFEVTKQEGK